MDSLERRYDDGVDRGGVDSEANVVRNSDEQRDERRVGGVLLLRRTLDLASHVRVRVRVYA